MTAPHHSNPYPHPARLILILSLAPTIGLGIGRFAYALVLPDMRDSLSWSYSAAGFMNTINAVGYLAGALTASPLIKRFGLVPSVIWGTAGLRGFAGAVRAHRQFHRAEFCAIAGRLCRGRRLRRRRRARSDDCAIPPRTRQLPAQPVLCRSRQWHPRLRIDRALRAASLRTRLVVDRVVGADGALARHDRAADAGAARRRRRDRPSRAA